ncbi:hypothetical protein Acr_24g0007910 [Actinidia rufa]|uniref:Uncharacterized protein n=1 Tax=Actinidia rufa TaxID=165716 RepID=A0A7J0GV49_9ERIC|nr:hypothetical protein Acr_24g0007910 [Actinidia rufa]
MAARAVFEKGLSDGQVRRPESWREKLTINCRRLSSGHGAARKYSVVQVTFCPLSSLGNNRWSLPLIQALSAVIVPSSQRRFGGNDGLSSGHSSIMVTASSSGTEGLRARSVATVGQDLCPGKASVKWCPQRAPTQGTTKLAL